MAPTKSGSFAGATLSLLLLHLAWLSPANIQFPEGVDFYALMAERLQHHRVDITTESTGSYCGRIIPGTGTVQVDGRHGDCSWKVAVPFGHKLTVTIPYLRLADCGSNQLTVYLRTPTGYFENATFSENYEHLSLTASVDVRIDLTAAEHWCIPSFTMYFALERLQYRLVDIPTESTDAGVDDCWNGGGRRHKGEACVCPPGYAGDSCQIACGWDRHGDHCEKSCSNSSEGCKGKAFCDGNMCTCAAGFRGSQCEQLCEFRFYGANCTQRCGNCVDGTSCDGVTGRCMKGCAPGYVEPSCQHELLHLNEPPEISALDTTIYGSFSMDSTNWRGRGDTVYYRVQYQVFNEEKSDSWTSAVLGRLEPGGVGKRQEFAINRLQPDMELDVRVLLMDRSMNAYDKVPAARVRTSGKRHIENLRATTVTAVSVQLDWESHDFKQGEYFFVRYQCLSLLACSKPCPQPTEAVTVAGLTASIGGLTPGASYRFSVMAKGNHEQSVLVTTKTLAPDAAVSALRLSAVTNSSALVEWAPAADCESMFGPVSSYDWHLSPVATGGNSTESEVMENTTMTNTMLTGLQPLRKYEFSVSVRNPDGSCPTNRIATINFTTHHTVPDEPQELAVYRLNRTALWLRWRPPGRPSGTLQAYVITIQTVTAPSGSAGATPVRRLLRSERIAAGTRLCAAWPALVCHVVSRLKPRTRYALHVSATNEHGDTPGEEAVVEASTVKGVSEPPEDLKVDAVDTQSANVSWRLPSLLNTDLTYFEVAVTRHVRPDEESFEDHEEPDADPERIPVSEERAVYLHSLQGLQPDASYIVIVSIGYGGRPARLEFTTLSTDTEANKSPEDKS